MAEYPTCIVLLPGFVGVLGYILLVKADEYIDQFAANGPASQQF
jgi:hypothetical protein